MGFFVDQQEDGIDFPGVGTIFIKHEMSQGDQTALEKTMYKLQIDGLGKGKPDIKGELELGNQKLLEINIIRMVDSDGKVTVATPAIIASLKRTVTARLLREISQRNPLVEEEKPI